MIKISKSPVVSKCNNIWILFFSKTCTGPIIIIMGMLWEMCVNTRDI